MGMNWTQLSMDDITMLFLYGSFSVPGELTNDALIRTGSYEPDTVGTTITIDAASYMAGFTGPGRFAYGSLSPIVQEFMGSRSQANNQELLENVPHTLNAEGQRIFNKDDIVGWYVANNYIASKSPIVVQQYEYQDDTNDVAIRTYIYGTTQFKLADGAQFVIDADGTRHIKNYAILPIDDNFDFKSNNPITSALESALINAIDPWKIGRTVEIKFDNLSSVPTKDYTAFNYGLDVELQSFYHTNLGGGLIDSYGPIQALVNRLFENGVTKFVDSPRRAQ